MLALSIVGGEKFALISREYLARPRDGVTYPYARRLRTRPQFQVLWAIVISYSVAVMHGLFHLALWRLRLARRHLSITYAGINRTNLAGKWSEAIGRW